MEKLTKNRTEQNRSRAEKRTEIYKKKNKINSSSNEFKSNDVCPEKKDLHFGNKIIKICQSIQCVKA